MSRNTNRYANYHSSRFPVRPRGKGIPGDLEDHNRYFRCKHCCFICDMERDTLGDGDGVIQLDAPEIAPGGTLSDDYLSATIIMDDMFTILQNGPDGNPITNYKHNQYPQVFSGCPNCGSKNWK